VGREGINRRMRLRWWIGTVDLWDRAVSWITRPHIVRWQLYDKINTANLRPDPEFSRPASSVLCSSEVIAAEMKQVVDLVVRCKEPLDLAGRFELLHLPPSSSRRRCTRTSRSMPV
jgi:hypothetical protein